MVSFVSQFHNKNQFLIETFKDKTYNIRTSVTFQSYDSTIAIIKNGKLKVYPNWDYSHTTRKHFYLFLIENKRDLGNFLYSQLFSKGFIESKNKRAFIQDLIDKKIIKEVPYENHSV